MFPAVIKQIISAACSSMGLMPSIGQVIHIRSPLRSMMLGNRYNCEYMEVKKKKKNTQQPKTWGFKPESSLT